MNKIYFFNAANFSYAEIDLKKGNIFFVGDNGSGKTTAIRAIHYYYNSDVKALGIDPNKESFKDFYFKYENSFIVYEFEEYFVLMYKRSGDIKRIFSKQKFDLSRVLRGSEILPINEVIAYANEAEIRFRAQTNEEYKKLIYGLNKRFADFKLTTIKNYNTFINLYNKIFNVNRAVFDAKSIKEVIFTTLDRVEAGEINYEDFANELREYREYFIFYKKFKDQSLNIEKLYIYKNALINLKEEIETLLKKIAYKKEIEKREIEKVLSILNELEAKKKKVLKQFGYFDKKIKKIEKCIEGKIYKLESKLDEIDELKKRFSLQKLQEAKSRVLKKEEINNRLIEIQTAINELSKGIKSEMEIIEGEIDRLKREKRVLKDRMDEEKVKIKREVEEIFFEKIEKVREKMIEKEKELLELIEGIEKEISILVDKKSEYSKELNEINFKYSKKENDLRDKFLKEVESLKSKKRSLQIKRDKIEEEIVKFKKEKNKLNNSFLDEIEEIKKRYQKEVVLTDEKILFYQNILETKPNSFKEFLNQNVDGWEEELYPIIDEKILSMDIEDLKPKVISERIFGIEMDKTKLKSIPTMREAESEIERLSEYKKFLVDEMQESISLKEKEFKSKEIEIISEIEVNEQKLKALLKEIELIDKEMSELYKKLELELEKLKNLKKEELKLVKVNIQKVDNQIELLKKRVNSIRNEIKGLKREFNKEKELLESEKKEVYNKRVESLYKEFRIKENEIDKKIKELLSKKNYVSKESSINDLQNEKDKLLDELKEIEKFEIFLKEFENKRGLIEEFESIKNELEKYKDYKKRVDNFFVRIEKRLNDKLLKIEKEIESESNKLETLKDGLKKVSNLKLPNEVIKTNEFLSVLIDEYRIKDSEFKEKRIALKDLASSIKTALERFVINGLEVNFNLENLSNLAKSELEKVDELYIFKDKKFEVLNKTQLKGLKNLISGIVEKKLDSFESAKEDFLHQVKKINSNLSRVDFGIVRGIKIEIEESKKDILKIFGEIKKGIEELIILMGDEHTFFQKSIKKIKKIEELFSAIKEEVKSESFSLIDVVDINVKFIENERENNLKVIKNESSTGGSILLKIAIAVSLLELFIKEKVNLFLILDEVSVLSTKNQKLLKEFVNQRGLGVIYVTPDLPLVDVEDIDIYKFRNVGGEFEVVKLIGDGGIKVEV